ncbi:MAG TPA: amino acid adenylation domain-containing protein, partial [Thermoanaerobaculia bacterium]|nr:amino acid adenylation domain-containing protein [Thermoanaerobaculia bacterium]
PFHTFAGARRFRRLPRELGEALPRLARQLDATPFMLLLAFWQVLLLPHTGEEDLVVGTPVANRTHRESEELIGFFVNTLALRTDLSGNPAFAEAVRRVRETALGAYTHQDLPFEKLVEELQPERSLRHTPLFQVMLIAEPAPAAAEPTAGAGGLQLDVLAVDNGTAKLDLTLIVQEGTPENARFELGFGYNTDLFFPTTIERLLTHGETLLAAALADPAQPVGDLPLLAAAERRQLLAEWNDTAGAASDLCLHELFAAQVGERPDAPAVLWESEVLSYGELDRQARRLASRLRARGVGPESRVGILLPRSPAAVVAILGVLQAGGAYLPLDPSHPAERIAFQLADSGAALVLTAESLSLPAEAAGPEGITVARSTPEHLVYVIYTSGSTGTPSGVLMSHRGAVHIVLQARDRLRLGPDNRMLQLATLGFDVSVVEIFAPLTGGATICIVGDEDRRSPAALAERLVRLGVDRAAVTPAFFAAHSSRALPGLTSLFTGGEALSAELAARWAPGRRLFNNYGPTEAAVYATSHFVRPDGGEPTIGRPIENVRAHLLDPRLQPVPIGVAGEICLAGPALARGYAGRPEKTAERFVPNPAAAAPGERLYRTGDLARLLPAGEIDFLGRIDSQVKVRGYRIEPGEIETALLRHPAVAQAAVVVRGEGAAERHLVAYVGSSAADPAELRRFLAGSLPEYMVPAVIVVLPALPVTANGK